LRNIVVLIPVLTILSFLPAAVTAQQFTNNMMTNLPLYIKSGQTLDVMIKTEPSISAEQIHAVKDALMSTNSFIKDGKIFYEGWQGALKATKHDTKFYMPVNLKILDSNNNQVKVIIILTSSKSDLGYSGYTTFIENHKVMKDSRIIIYEADKLSRENLVAITRHEFGHAIGLGHSTLYGDLMYPDINIKSAFISECDVKALIALYDGKGLSQVVCEK